MAKVQERSTGHFYEARRAKKARLQDDQTGNPQRLRDAEYEINVGGKWQLVETAAFRRSYTPVSHGDAKELAAVG